MVKGCLFLLVFAVVALGTLYYVYEKYGDKINKYADEKIGLFYEEKIKPSFENFSGDYSDSVKALLEKEISLLSEKDLKLGKQKLAELKKILSEYSKKEIIDSLDFENLKKFFD